MADVFISYSHADRHLVNELASVLEARGLSCWWDREIGVGARVEAIIERELSVAKAVVVVWSDSAVTSDWVRSEASDALDRGVLVPVSIADAKIPLPFRSVETANLVGWPQQNNDYQLSRMISAVELLVAGPGTAQISRRSQNALDPSFSSRVAERITKAMNTATVGEIVKLRAELALEKALSEISVAIIERVDLDTLFNYLLSALRENLGATVVNIWQGTTLRFGSRKLGEDFAAKPVDDADKLVTRESARDKDLALLRAYGVDWICFCKRGLVTLCVGASGSDGREYSARIPFITQVLGKAFEITGEP